VRAAHILGSAATAGSIAKANGRGINLEKQRVEMPVSGVPANEKPFRELTFVAERHINRVILLGRSVGRYPGPTRLRALLASHVRLGLGQANHVAPRLVIEGALQVLASIFVWQSWDRAPPK